jgi:ATP-dependent DNA helicase RecG
MPGFRVARMDVHSRYLAAARDDAALQMQRDPGLETARGKALRDLLYLFGKDDAIRLLRAG